MSKRRRAPSFPRGELTAEEKSNISIFEKLEVVGGLHLDYREGDGLLDAQRHERPSWYRLGFVWDELGHVVTNLHVVSGAASANVRLADGRDYPATLIGASAAHDIAVLKINVPNNQPAPIPVGTSHDLQVGQKVFAIGNPFGLDWTLTTGIVSALDRSLTGDDGVVIQHLVQDQTLRSTPAVPAVRCSTAPVA